MFSYGETNAFDSIFRRRVLPYLNDIAPPATTYPTNVYAARDIPGRSMSW